jgi:hypothetical protein
MTKNHHNLKETLFYFFEKIQFIYFKKLNNINTIYLF